MPEVKKVVDVGRLFTAVEKTVGKFNAASQDGAGLIRGVAEMRTLFSGYDIKGSVQMSSEDNASGSGRQIRIPYAELGVRGVLTLDVGAVRLSLKTEGDNQQVNVDETASSLFIAGAFGAAAIGYEGSLQDRLSAIRTDMRTLLESVRDGTRVARDGTRVTREGETSCPTGNNTTWESDAKSEGMARYAQCVYQSDEKRCKSVFAAALQTINQARNLSQQYVVECNRVNQERQKRLADAALQKEIESYNGTVQAHIDHATKMRQLAVKEDSILNRTTPKDVDKVTAKYLPLITAASAATPIELAKKRYELSEMMMRELYETPTAHNLFFKMDPFCTKRTYQSKCAVRGYVVMEKETCHAPGLSYSESRERQIESHGCVNEVQCKGKGCP